MKSLSSSTRVLNATNLMNTQYISSPQSREMSAEDDLQCPIFSTFKVNLNSPHFNEFCRTNLQLPELDEGREEEYYTPEKFGEYGDEPDRVAEIEKFQSRLVNLKEKLASEASQRFVEILKETQEVVNLLSQKYASDLGTELNEVTKMNKLEMNLLKMKSEELKIARFDAIQRISYELEQNACDCKVIKQEMNSKVIQLKESIDKLKKKFQRQREASVMSCIDDAKRRVDLIEEQTRQKMAEVDKSFREAMGNR